MKNICVQLNSLRLDRELDDLGCTDIHFERRVMSTCNMPNIAFDWYRTGFRAQFPMLAHIANEVDNSLPLFYVIQV